MGVFREKVRTSEQVIAVLRSRPVFTEDSLEMKERVIYNRKGNGSFFGRTSRLPFRYLKKKVITESRWTRMKRAVRNALRR